MREKYLPIGTVVLLKDATKRLMITGYCSAKPEEVDKVYDYVGMLFPEGNLVGDEVALFNHDQIGSISHMGLEDDEFKQLEKNIKSALTSDDNGQPALTSLDAKEAEETPALVPFTPDNINNILTQIKNSGDAFTPISEPTAFNEEILKKPAFQMPSLGGDSSKEDEKKEEKNALEEKVNIDTSEKDVTDFASENVLDGQPVLQLQPIFTDESDNSSVGDGNGLSRL